MRGVVSSPAAAYALLVTGALAIYVEACRPGWVIPGAAGSVLVLLALASFATMGCDPRGVALMGTGVLVVLAEAVWRWPGIPGAAGSLLLACGAAKLVPARPIPWLAALPLSWLLAAATVLLGSLAWRGYWAKRLGS
jgi:membrane-bound serine protease (ClpP class)